jgi:hypothetical protein
MSKSLGLAVLRDDYDGARVPVMEHFSPLSREALVHFTGIDPVAEPARVPQAFDRMAEILEVDLLWGGPLPTGDRPVYDWSDGETMKRNTDGQSVVQWGIFHTTHAEDGRHYHHIPKPQSVDEALDFQPDQWFTESVDELAARFQVQHDRNLKRNGELCYTLPQHYTTAFHFPLAIFGFELYCMVGMEASRFDDLMARFVAVTQRITTAWSRVEGLRGFICHDDLTMTSGPIFPPQWYRDHIFPHYPRAFAPLKDAGVPIVFTSDGNCGEFADDIFAAGADGLNFEHWVGLERLVGDWPDKILIGNLNSHTLAAGPVDRIEREIRHAMAVGSRARRFVVNVGGQLTHDIPVAHLERYLELRRALARSVRA